MSSAGGPGAGGGSGAPSYGGQGPPTAGGSGAGPSQAAGKQDKDLNQIVTDYLLKRGFTKTEAIFRQESSRIGNDGRPFHQRVDEMGPKQYLKAFNLLKTWIENNLDLYKFELRKLLWPVFVYSYLQLVSRNYSADALIYLDALKAQFEPDHHDDLRTFSTVTLAQHLPENQTTSLYLNNRYRIPLNQYISGTLFTFLERENDTGGSVIAYILETYCIIDTTARGPIEPYSFEAIWRRTQNVELEEVDEQEGIPGVFTGLSNKQVLDPAPLKLGPLPTEADLRDDVRAELEDEDQRHPPPDGKPTLVEEFDRKIKREESADGPARTDLPLPPSRTRDIVMEMQKVRENRDRFRIEGRTGGVGVPISVCMFTFHNSMGSVSCMDFTKDHALVAVGTMESYIRVYSLDGKALKSKVASEKDVHVNNRKLIGHGGPVYGVCFSDSAPSLGRTLYEGDDTGSDTSAKMLLSCSADGQVRLWSLEAWACLCIYKAHDGPVFRVLWGPHGHYFATAGWDKTVRVFMQDHASAQRIMVGHDSSLSALAWHSNGTYVFSASDETDKSIRMWSVSTGGCVRVFSGHTDYISALECSPDGKILASADAGGNIYFWDIAKGTRIKRCRGHGKGGIPSLSFSAESNVLLSGGLDGTVRLWDVELLTDGSKAPAAGASGAPAAQQAGGVGGVEDTVMVGGQPDGRSITVGGQPAQPAAAAATGASGSAGTGKKKGKEVQVTADQISAFATKKTPVMKVHFTRMNLAVAGGCYDPER